MGFPIVLIHFPSLKSGQPLYKVAGLNVSFIKRFQCTRTNTGYNH